MELDTKGSQLAEAILEGINKQAKEEFQNELRTHLSKGNWFLKGAESLVNKNPIYYDEMGVWWVWNHDDKIWEQQDDVRVLNICRKTLQLIGDTSVRHSHNLLKALQQVGAELRPKEPPLSWVQFGETFYDINTGEQVTSTPEYFSTNTIPWKIGDTVATPQMDALIKSWVGEEYLQTVYEIIAYCVYRDYPIHRIFCFVGTGANGKTRLLKIIEKFVGPNNKASVTLKKIGTNDFALYPLYRKTVCFVGETAHHRLESTEILKALSGQDPVSFEDKGKTSFTGQNYAKLIIGTNVLPPSSDTSRGWYRRWFVLKFPNEFEEGEDVLSRIPDSEYEALAAKVVRILPALLKRGGFDKEGTIEDRQAKYIENSNPLKHFISEYYERDSESKVRYTECYIDYLQFLSNKKLRKVTKKEFSAALEDESFEVQRTSIRDPETYETKTFSVIWGIKRLPVQRNMRDMRDMHVSLLTSISSNIRNTEQVESGAYRAYLAIDRINGVYGSTGNEGGQILWREWINEQPGGTTTIEEFIAFLVTNCPGIDYETLKINGEVYEPRAGYVRAIL